MYIFIIKLYRYINMDSPRITRTLSAKTLSKHDKLSSILKYIFIDICKIDQNKYFILGSFSLREYRVINDLDINLDCHEFLKLEKAVKRGFGHIEFYNGQIRWVLDLTDEYNILNATSDTDFSIEVFMKDKKTGFPNNQFSLDYLLKTNGLDIDRNGHPFFNLRVLLKWKKTMNRAKDIADISLINDLIKA